MASALLRLQLRRLGPSVPPWRGQSSILHPSNRSSSTRTSTSTSTSKEKPPPPLRDYQVRPITITDRQSNLHPHPFTTHPSCHTPFDPIQQQRALLSEARRLVFTLKQSRLLCPVATGLGKTVLFANLPYHLTTHPSDPPPRTLVLVHRDELVRQAVAAFERWGPPGLRVGVEKGRERVEDPGQVCMSCFVTWSGSNGRSMVESTVHTSQPH